MTDLMALFQELMATIMMLVTKPFSLVKLSFIFGVKSFCIVINTWVELLRAAISFHLSILWRLLIWNFALISLPVRVLTALQRERLLQMHLQELQIELENLVWNQKQLEERLHMAIKECRIMESMLAEIEDEHDEAIVKIELLESELQVIKEENLRLKEIQGRGHWSLQSQDDTSKGNDHDDVVADKYNVSYEIQSWKCSFNGSSTILEDVLTHKDALEGERKRKSELLDSKASGTSHAVTRGFFARNLYTTEVLVQQREIAVLRSIFSAVLSLIVGMIIWEAEDPCTPLVVALFTVVGMSLKSVIQFFSAVKNKPASEAVALLSFTCFILGTLTYPTLPRIAHMLTPTALSFLKQMASWLGFSH